MKRITNLILAILMVTSAIAVSGVAVAQESEESYFDQLVEPGDQGAPGVLPADIERSAAQQLSRALTLGPRLYQKYVGGASGENATEYADDVQASFNEHNETLVAYANDRITADTDHDVIAIEFTDTSGNTDTRYVVADVSNESYDSAQMVESTDRSVDETITLEWYASRHAADELDTFVDDYADPGKNVSARYYGEMLGKYGPYINSTLWGDA